MVDLVEQYEQGLIKVIQARFDNEQALEEDHLCDLDQLYRQSTQTDRDGFRRVSREISTKYLNPGGMPHTRPPN